MTFSWILGAMVMAQVVNGYNDISFTLNGNVIKRISHDEFTYPNIDLPIMNTKKYDEFLNELDKQLSIPPKDAILDQSGNIIPEKAGSQIHRQAFTELFYAHFFTKNTDSIEIPMHTVYPKVDSELLSDISSMRIGRYVTSFNTNNENRSTNIRLATSAINNYVIFPGETFSFNKVVGKRTKESGYLKAPVIIRGELDEDIGGGICQVSSTLFNAVDNAGLEIVQRFSHTRKVPYIPPGRDATVSWYGPDFVFRNKYNQPVLIQARTIGRYLVIKVYSSENINYKPKKVPFPS